MPSRKNEAEVEVLSGGAGRRRRWTAAEKVAIVRETLEPGMSPACEFQYAVKGFLLFAK